MRSRFSASAGRYAGGTILWCGGSWPASTRSTETLRRHPRGTEPLLLATARGSSTGADQSYRARRVAREGTFYPRQALFRGGVRRPGGTPPGDCRKTVDRERAVPPRAGDLLRKRPDALRALGGDAED